MKSILAIAISLFVFQSASAQMIFSQNGRYGVSSPKKWTKNLSYVEWSNTRQVTNYSETSDLSIWFSVLPMRSVYYKDSWKPIDLPSGFQYILKSGYSIVKYLRNNKLVIILESRSPYLAESRVLLMEHEKKMFVFSIHSVAENASREQLDAIIKELITGEILKIDQ